MTRLYLIRHGETAWNVDKRFQGQADVPLNEAGCEQAEVVAGALAEMAFDRIYASDLGRAADTARAIARYHDIPLTLDPRWRECGTGVWTGMTVDEVNERWPGVVEAWWRYDACSDATPEGGESIGELVARVREVMLAMGEAHPDEHIAVATHGGTIRAAITVALDVAPAIFPRMRVDNCSITVIDVHPTGFYLRGLNDISHFSRKTMNLLGDIA